MRSAVNRGGDLNKTEALNLLNTLVKNEISKTLTFFGIDKKADTTKIVQEIHDILKQDHSDLSFSKLSNIISKKIINFFNIVGYPIDKSNTFDNIVFNKDDPTIFAAKAVAKDHGETKKNPLFLYNGNKGTGKTQLIQAIGNQIRKNNPEKVVAYFPTDSLTGQIISALEKNDINAFLEKLYNVDVLLLDDIDYLSNNKLLKKREFEEKIHNIYLDILDKFYGNTKQIIFTSKQAPAYLDIENKQLAGRLKWGMSAEVNPPGKIARLDFIESQFSELGINIQKDKLDSISIMISLWINNIEEVKNLIKIIKNQYDIDPDKIDSKFVEDKMKIVKRTFTKDEVIFIVINEVANYFDFQIDEMLQKSNKREYAQARQIAMYLIKKKFSKENHGSFPKISLSQIANGLNKNNHATVLHANKTISNLLESDDTLVATVNNLEKSLNKKFGVKQ